jgi:hypothetical protein
MKRLISTLLILLSLQPLVLAAPVVGATTNDKLFAACDTNQQAANSPICADRNTTVNPVNQKLKVATDIVAILAGLAAVIIIIASGLTLITSAGNTEAVTNARKRITSAIIGLVIIALAWTIIAFVLDRLVQ